MIGQQPLQITNRNNVRTIVSMSSKNEVQQEEHSQCTQQINQCSRQNKLLREQMIALQIQTKQLHQSQSNLMIINRQLKEKNNHAVQQIEEWKKKTSILRAELSQNKIAREELCRLKDEIQELKDRNRCLQQQKNKIVELSLEEKISADQIIAKASLNKINSHQYQQQLETELYQSKQTIYKLQAQIKILQIRNQEETFNRKWSQSNLQKEHYEKIIQEKEQLVIQLRNKSRKEKQNRAQLEGRILELEQRIGFFSVMAQKYEEQIQFLQKKVTKTSRGISQAKQTSNKMISQKANWQQKFTKSVEICEQLISRVKRELIGSAVQLAKTCEFRLGKLKQTKQNESKAKSIAPKEISKSTKKIHKPKKEQENKVVQQTNQQAKPLSKILCNFDTNKTIEETIKLKQSLHSTQKINISKQGSNNIENELATLQAKVRRQRDEMQKKLKEKMLYRQLQIANSPQRGKLRQEYLNLLFHKMI